MKKILNRCLFAGSALVLCSAVLAKLPAPVLTDEAKAKAAEAAAKTAWSAKMDAYLSCKAQDKVVAHYLQTARASAKEAKPPMAMPPCTDPGAFAYIPTPPEPAKPLEASGAHSPPATATSPPSTLTPAAALAPGKK